jgi:hypothetical protein
MSNTKSDNKVEVQQVVAPTEGAPNEGVKPAPISAGLVQASAEEVLLKYTRCNQCQARLHFSYLTDFSRNLTQETARCPECHHQAHRVMHRLQ